MHDLVIYIYMYICLPIETAPGTMSGMRPASSSASIACSCALHFSASLDEAACFWGTVMADLEKSYIKE